MAINETKIITKSADDNGFYTKRERAQKINFAQIQEILQRNVTSTSNKSYTQYTKELIKLLKEDERFIHLVNRIGGWERC